MGVLGLLYWEYESKPTGSGGYYFSSIGVEDGVYKTNSSLCTTHDDGGTVTAYGYGYYWSFGSETSPTLQTGSITVLGAEDAKAAAALRHQMPALNFVTYRTANDGLHLTSGTQANDAWTLTHEGAALTYTVSPFFADAFALSSNNAPGTASKPYQVRSIEQLQYINWSYIDSQGSTTRDVTGSNSDYKYYPYLQYTNRRGNALQTKAMALAGDSTGGPRPILTWQQTHDLNGAGHGTAADGTAANYDFHPIAGAVNNGQLNRGNETYDLTLYNWFGGIYDGGNYYIKNVNITSHCDNVGLFGTTAGAEIKNIVLYSDNDAVIQRKTDATPASGATGPENYATSYALGGLVGIAYDYDENLKDKTKVSTISNCAIAGYTVTDNSKNRQFVGEAAIGGLVGVSSANLNRCSAVVKLNINCTHRYASETNTGAMNKAQWGNYVRVGGLVGGVRYDVSDCYTGGSITVANDLLNERILTGEPNTSFVDRYEKTPKSVKMTQGGAEAGPDTYVYIGGIGGSGFSATFSNFSGSKDGQPTYNNCYTYMTFPAMEGTITGISLIGSIADRAGVNGGGGIALSGTPVSTLPSAQNSILGSADEMPVSSGGSVDAAYILATPEQIAYIKPMIAMRNGSQSNVTLYASSRSAQGTAGPDFRLEMEGLQYSEIPMLAGSNPSLMQQALSAVRNDYSLARLYAMGADAWSLANHFTQMRQTPGFELNGNTGDLTANQDCVINRKLSWLKYQQGKIVPAS